MIEELPDYIVECLDEFLSHYGTLEEVVEHKDDIYYYPDCETTVSYTHQMCIRDSRTGRVGRQRKGGVTMLPTQLNRK